jgi:hypothetical protein
LIPCVPRPFLFRTIALWPNVIWLQIPRVDCKSSTLLLNEEVTNLGPHSPIQSEVTHKVQ